MDVSIQTKGLKTAAKRDCTSDCTSNAKTDRDEGQPTTGGLTGNHGFSFNVPSNLAPGAHVFAAYALDSRTGQETLIGTKSNTVSKAPVGYFDFVNKTSLGGWAYDPDVTSTSINVRVDIDGVTFQTIAANVSRPDVNTAFGIAGNHGFLMTMPVLASGSHTVSVFAIDSSSLVASLISSKTLVV